MTEKLNVDLLLRHLENAQSVDIQKRALSMEYCSRDKWKNSWPELLHIIFEYFQSPNPQAAIAPAVFWCFQVLESCSDLISTQNPEVFKQFITAITSSLKGGDSLSDLSFNNTSFPAFLKNRLAVFIAGMFFRMPDAIVECLSGIKFDMLLRICSGFEEIIGPETLKEKDMLKRVIPGIYGRFSTFFIVFDAADPASEELNQLALSALRVVSSFVEWLEIDVTLSLIPTISRLYTTKPKIAPAIVEYVIQEMVRKKMPADQKLELLRKLDISLFLQGLFASDTSFIDNEEMLKALVLILNSVGTELSRIYLETSSNTELQNNVMQCLSQACLPSYLKVFEISSKLKRAQSLGSRSNLLTHKHHSQDSLNEGGMNDSSDSLAVDDIDNVTVELVEFSYQLVQIFVKRADVESISKILDLYGRQLNADIRLLKEYRSVIDLISTHYPNIVGALAASTDSIWPLLSLSEAKGKSCFVDNNNTFSEVGQTVIRLMTNISHGGLPLSSLEADFISRFSFVFNVNKSEIICNLYLEMLNFLLGTIQQDEKRWYVYLAAANKLLKTKSIQLVRNNQSLIATLLNLLFKLAFLSEWKPQQQEILNEGFASVGMVVDDIGILSDLVNQLRILYRENCGKPIVHYAIGYIIKGLLSAKIVNDIPGFQLLYSDIMQTSEQLTAQTNALGNIATDPLRDSMVFAVTKLCQILKSCDVHVYSQYFADYPSDLISTSQYLYHKFRVVDSQVMVFILEYLVQSKVVNLPRYIAAFGYFCVLEPPLNVLSHIIFISGRALSAIVTGSPPLETHSISGSASCLIDNSAGGEKIDAESQKNQLLKLIINFHRKHRDANNELELCTNILKALQMADQNNGSLLQVINELYAFMKQVYSTTANQAAFPNSLHIILSSQNEKEAKRDFRQFVRHSM